ncbi:MAG: fumarylacetoacetate hydrolase family protein [Desulfobacterales bacterium]|jgi:2-keto-4-pentenoate hydratase/2-oxohepta-3-ene-1,7-dioic acid hydratase in catechol pathway|nr:fumarylacetoacetate hydrolase family protein [Desulfobacterales bacterium]
MHLIRFGEKGKERPGLWQHGNIVDLTAVFREIPDIGEDFFREGWLETVRAVKAPGTRMRVRIGCPVSRPGKIICLGKNYAAHAKETGLDMPKRPLLFCKTANALSGPFDSILMPQSSCQIDWEVELAVIIGREGKRITRAAAFDYIAGFSVFNDVSGRDAQFAEGQWFRGKSFDTFAPMGPALVTLDDIGGPEDLQRLRLTTVVNGVTMQDGNTREMIFTLPEIIADISQDITLMPGDIIATGTPAGVGFFRDPPILLKAGDVVTCAIEKIGAIENRVVAE